jgi:TP901 family phage tail tape measure protein
MSVGRMGATYTLDIDEKKVSEAFDRLERRGSTVASSMGKGLTRAMAKGKEGVRSVSKSLAKMERRGSDVVSTLAKGFATGVLGSASLVAGIGKAVQVIGRLTLRAQEFSAAFETGLAEISTLLDGHLMPQMAAFEQQLVNISVKGDQSLKTLARATYDAISAGITGFKEQISVVREADIAATAGLTKTATAMNAFVRLKNAFKEEAGTYRQINDLLFTTVKQGLTTFPKMATAIGNVAGTAAQAGLSMKETLAAFAAVTRVTKNSNTAMTYLRNLIVAILKPGQQAKQAFEELGVSYGQAALQSKGLIGIMQEIKKATGGAAEQIATLFPSQRAMQAAMTLAGRGLSNFTDSLEAMNKSAGASQVAYKKMADTWEFQTKRSTNIVSALLMRLHGPIFDRIKTALSAFNSWYEENRRTVDAWARGIGAAFGAIVDLVGGAVKILWTLAKPIRWLIEHNPFVWMFKYANEYDAAWAEQQRNISTTVDKTKKLNAVTKQYALVQQQIISGGVELSAAMQRLADKMAKLNSQQRESIRLSLTHRMEAIRSIIGLERERIRLFEQGKLKEAAAINKTLIPLKKQHNRMGVGLHLLEMEEKAGERILAMLKKKSDRITQAGLAGVAAQRFIVRGYDQERRLELRRVKDLQKIDALKLKDRAKHRQAVAAINAYWDRRIAEMRKKNERKTDRMERTGNKAPRIASSVAMYAKERARKAKEAARQDRSDARLMDRSVANVQKRLKAEDAAFEKMAKSGIEKARQYQSAVRRLVLAKAEAGTSRGSFFDIVFGSDEQLNQRFGKMFETLGISAAHFRTKIQQFHSPDLIASAAVWWAQLTGTGKQGAQAYANAIQSTFQTLATGILNAWIDMFKGLITGSDNLGLKLVASILNTIAEIAGQWALFYVAQGIAFLAAQAYANAALSFAAAIAFGALAAGAAIGSAAASSAASPQTTTSSSRGATGQVRDNTRPDSAKQGDINVTINYGTVVPANKRQIQEFGQETAKALNTLVHTGTGIDERVLRRTGS